MKYTYKTTKTVRTALAINGRKKGENSVRQNGNEDDCTA